MHVFTYMSYFTPCCLLEVRVWTLYAEGFHRSGNDDVKNEQDAFLCSIPYNNKRMNERWNNAEKFGMQLGRSFRM